MLCEFGRQIMEGNEHANVDMHRVATAPIRKLMPPPFMPVPHLTLYFNGVTVGP